MQRTIYVKDEIWNEIRKTAEGNSRSISNYLIWLHRSNLYQVSSEEPILKKLNTKIKEVVLEKKETAQIWKNPLTNSALAPKK